MPRKNLIQEQNEQARVSRMILMQEGKLRTVQVAVPGRALKGRDRSTLVPVTEGLGDRLTPNIVVSRSLREIKFTDDYKVVDAPTLVQPKSRKLAKEPDYIGSYYGWHGTMKPEYEMMEPFVLFDTEAYLKQAVNRKLSLMFRNGFQIISDQPRLADYIKRRLDTIEYVMEKSTATFFKDILFNLCLCSNCFLLKIRDEKASNGKKTDNNNNRQPIAGYSIIPSHTLFPYLEKGVIQKWRRVYDTGQPYIDYSPEEIIHFRWDRKSSHIFGTPRTVAVRDDIFALRRLEENIELLFINHLFPLYHVKVGTAEASASFLPDGTSEVDVVRQQIETMPKEGVFVTDERCEVAAVGAEGKSLDTKDLIAHLKGRVYTGLGMSPLDMGEGDTANKSTADNISQVLKDSIKADLETFADQIRLFIFKELFQETNISLGVQRAVSQTRLEFHEIDMDNKIKSENHTIEKFNNHVITHEEARKDMRMKPLEKTQNKDTHYERHVKDLETHKAKLKVSGGKELAEHATGLEKQLITHQTKEGAKQAESQIALNKSEVETAHGKAAAERKAAVAKVTVLRAKTKHAIAVGKSPTAASHGAKSVANKNRPANQHGRNTDPHKARSSKEILGHIYDRLIGALDLCDPNDIREWKNLSASAFERALQEMESLVPAEDAGSTYTNNLRQSADRLKAMIALHRDPELLYTILSNFDPEEDNVEPESERERIADGTSGGDSGDEDATEPGDSEPDGTSSSQE